MPGNDHGRGHRERRGVFRRLQRGGRGGAWGAARSRVRAPRRVGQRPDRDLHQERLRTYRDAFPDGRYELADVFANGDLAAVRWVFTGTLQGPFAGVEPEGQPVAVRGVHIHRIECGQIVEGWSEPDSLGLLRQLGVVPEVNPVGATPTN